MNMLSLHNLEDQYHHHHAHFKRKTLLSNFQFQNLTVKGENSSSFPKHLMTSIYLDLLSLFILLVSVGDAVLSEGWNYWNRL